MKILNSLIASTCIITSFGMNSSFATDNNIVNNQLSNQANQVNNQINTNVQPQVKTIKIGYDDVPLSNEGILDFRFKCYKDFFSKEYNKFANFDDLKFAPTYLKKLVESFNNEVNTKKYDDNESEILQIKGVFSDVLKEIINKENDYYKTHNLTVEQLVKINDLLKEAKDTISISTNSNLSETKVLNNTKRKIRKFKRIHESSKTININYKDVKLSKQGIRDIRLNLYKSFFSKDNNKFKSYEDLMFAPTFLGKLVKHFHDQVKTRKYTNSRVEIRRIKSVFRNILDNIIKKTTESIQQNNFTAEEKNEISNRINMAAETIRISNNSKAPRITMWDNIY